MSIAGKYIIANEEGYDEFLIKLGATKDDIKEKKGENYTVEFIINGSNITRTTTSNNKSITTKIPVGEEYDDEIEGVSVKTTAKLQGSVLTIESKLGSETWKKVYKFSDCGLEIAHNSSKAGEAKQTFKRL